MQYPLYILKSSLVIGLKDGKWVKALVTKELEKRLLESEMPSLIGMKEYLT